MPKKAKRALGKNAERREKDRQTEKTKRDLERLDAAAVGGSPERPIDIESASQVEVRTEAERCPLCNGPLRAVSHETCEHKGVRLRVAEAVCKVCHTKRKRYFRIQERVLN